MGGGTYSYTRDLKRKQQNASKTREEVFTQTHMSKDMKISGKIRECRDSDEHPTTYPIIIALDTTGSMGEIPNRLVTRDFPKIMQKIMDAGVEHPQVCFVGVGDQYSDEAPIQVGQFEASDELLDKWLKTIYLEGHGGGNGGESYQLAWYFAVAHTSVDAYLKRGVKGTLITIGDEPTHGSLRINEVDWFFGDKCEAELPTSKLLKMAQKQWHVYHINLRDWSGSDSDTQNQWSQLLGERFINTRNSSGDDIADIIAKVVIASYKKENGSVIAPVATDATQPDNDTNVAHLL
jgi:hypothetical protein